MHHGLGTAARHVIELLFGNTLRNQIGDETGMPARTVVGSKIRLATQKLGVLGFAHQGIGALRAHNHLDIGTGANQLLRMHEQGCGAHAAGNQQNASGRLGHMPTMANRPHKANLCPGFYRGELLAPEADHLVQDNQLGALAHMEHRERTAQDMAFHTRDKHVHELARLNVPGDIGRIDGKEPKPIGELLVGNHLGLRILDSCHAAYLSSH